MGRKHTHARLWCEVSTDKKTELLKLAYPNWPLAPNSRRHLITVEMVQYAELLDTQIYLAQLGWASVKQHNAQHLRVHLAPGVSLAQSKLQRLDGHYAATFIVPTRQHRSVSILRTNFGAEFTEILESILGHYPNVEILSWLVAGFTAGQLRKYLRKLEQKVDIQIGGSIANFYLILDALT